MNEPAPTPQRARGKRAIRWSTAGAVLCVATAGCSGRAGRSPMPVSSPEPAER